MASPIWNEKENRWKMDLTKDGVRKVFTSSKVGKSGRLEVNRKLRAWQEGKADLSKARVQKCWDEFMLDSSSRCQKSTYKNLAGYGKYYILPDSSKRRIAAMLPGDWQKIINDAKPLGRLKKDGTRIYQTKTLSKKTYSNIRGTIVTFCHFCKRAGYIDEAPDLLYVPRFAEKVGKEILQPKQIRTLFEEADDWYINSWRFMLLTGLRPGECYALVQTDIRDGILYVRRAIDPDRNITDGKSKNAKRTIYLPELAIKIVEDQLARIAYLKTDLIFPNVAGSLPHPSWAYREWKKYGAAHGINVPLYSLRHTHVSIMQSKLPAGWLKANLGHSESMDTFGVYAHEVDGDKEKSAKITNIAFESVLEK